MPWTTNCLAIFPHSMTTTFTVRPSGVNSAASVFCGHRLPVALRRDQFHPAAIEWQRYLVGSGAAVITTEAVCWEWMNAMSGLATRTGGFDDIQHDPRIEVVPHSAESSGNAVRLFASRTDKEWSLTDCLSFGVMERRNIRDALTADAHFEQAGFRAVLSSRPQ